MPWSSVKTKTMLGCSPFNDGAALASDAKVFEPTSEAPIANAKINSVCLFIVFLLLFSWPAQADLLKPVPGSAYFFLPFLFTRLAGTSGSIPRPSFSNNGCSAWAQAAYPAGIKCTPSLL